MSLHSAILEWTGPDADEFLAGHYSREHRISFDSGVTLAGSASPSVVRAPWSVAAAADPEELFTASLAACHMLWFLDFAKHAGIVVTAYRDEPVGRMGKMPSGRIGVVECVLRPSVTCDADAATLDALHHKAHDACNIANSVLTIVRVEPAPQGASTHG